MASPFDYRSHCAFGIGQGCGADVIGAAAIIWDGGKLGQKEVVVRLIITLLASKAGRIDFRAGLGEPGRLEPLVLA